jgi:hypothetical protein
LRIAGSAAGPIAALIAVLVAVLVAALIAVLIAVLVAVLVAVLKGRPPALEPDPIEWPVLDPGEDLAPGSRHIGTIEGVCTEPPDEDSGPAGFETREDLRRTGSVSHADEHYFRAQRQ